MAWLYLIAGGILEVAWAYGLQESHGFTKPVPSVLTAVALAASFAFFAKSMKAIEIGTAYAVFTGLGTAGTVLVGMLWLGDPVQFGKLFFVTLLLCGIIGLKLIAKDKPAPAQKTAAAGSADIGMNREEAAETGAQRRSEDASVHPAEREVR